MTHYLTAPIEVIDRQAVASVNIKLRVIQHDLTWYAPAASPQFMGLLLGLKEGPT